MCVRAFSEAIRRKTANCLRSKWRCVQCPRTVTQLTIICAHPPYARKLTCASTSIYSYNNALVANACFHSYRYTPIHSRHIHPRMYTPMYRGLFDHTLMCSRTHVSTYADTDTRTHKDADINRATHQHAQIRLRSNFWILFVMVWVFISVSPTSCGSA